MNNKINRFASFNPEERNILLALLQEHANAVSEIAACSGQRVAHYLLLIEALEMEAKQSNVSDPVHIPLEPHGKKRSKVHRALPGKDE